LRQAEQQRAQQLAEEQRLRQAAQERAQQLAEQQRVQQAEQARAQQLAEQRRAEEAARQQLADQERARRLAEERARQEQAQQAEEAARRQAEENTRLAQEQARQARERALADAAPPGPARVGADGGGGDGAGRGNGTLPRGALGSDLASRAREMMRGIDILKPVPRAVQPAEDAARAVRRALAEAARHDIPLRMYMDSVRQKIERNAVLSEAQLSADIVRTDPIVSVAIRSDGSVEDVTILRSSGRADIDEFVRRIVRLNARYSAFPPNVAANYDVIELRRVWRFAGVLRLLEEMR
jgi:outer membrane biosynthesis protein TonB